MRNRGKYKKNVILSRSEGSHNIEILQSLRSFSMTDNGTAPSLFVRGQNFLKNVVSLEIRERVNKKRNELINLSTYPLIHFRKPAFTLAETLITLGIIGVVAAMTLPALMTAYNKHITETRLKKFYSLFNQAIRLSIVENEEPEGWTSYWDAAENKKDDDGNVIEQSDVVDAAFNKYLAPYMKISHKKRVRDVQKNYTVTLYYLADGSAFTYRSLDTRNITFYPKNPEKCIAQNKSFGVCAFAFIFNPTNNREYWKYHYKKGLEPFVYEWDGTKESLYKNRTYSCAGEASTNGSYCTAIIKENGWKIPSDYPLKIQY